jgi:hypothetical protein
MTYRISYEDGLAAAADAAYLEVVARTEYFRTEYEALNRARQLLARDTSGNDGLLGAWLANDLRGSEDNAIATCMKTTFFRVLDADHDYSSDFVPAEDYRSAREPFEQELRDQLRRIT